MKTLLNKFALALLIAMLAVTCAFAQTPRISPSTGTTTLSVIVGPEGSLVINTATTDLKTDPAAAAFTAYTGTTEFLVKIRTSKSGGTGSITALATEFNSGGPSIGGGNLKYGATLGIGAPAGAGTVAKTSGATDVVTFGANARSEKAGAKGYVNWTLENDPQYETNTYTSTVTFTLSVS